LYVIMHLILVISARCEMVADHGGLGGSKKEVQAAQIVKSSGAPRLDEACIKAVLNQSMKPGSRDGILVDACVTLPIVWKLKDSKGYSVPPAGHDGTVRPIPMLAGDQALNLDPPYDPRSAADQRIEAHLVGLGTAPTITRGTEIATKLWRPRPRGGSHRTSTCLSRAAEVSGPAVVT
jgi:TonB family protein